MPRALIKILFAFHVETLVFNVGNNNYGDEKILD